MRIALALFALTFLPGIPLASVFFRNLRNGIAWVSIAGILGLLWSTAVTTVLAIAHIPLAAITVMTASLLPAAVLLSYPHARASTFRAIRTLSFPPMSIALVLLTIGALLTIFLTVQRGLPTGDVQKAIFWGEKILESSQLPNYTEAASLNRDPTDFATPALHALTAAVMRLSGDPLRGPAWLAFLSGLFLPGIAAAFASVLAPRYQSILPPLAFLLAAANARALRYTAAPGYHYQNLFGELFLFLSVFALLHAVGGRGHQRSVLMTVAAGALLPFVHQFSTFLAVLLLPIIFALLVLKYRGEVAAILLNRFPRGRGVVMIGALLLGGITALLVILKTSPVSNVSARLITFTPHLRDSLIPLSGVPELLGVPVVLLGIAGILIAIIGIRRQELEWRWVLLLTWIALFLVISQGPRGFLDIPSARTLFYLPVSLAIVAALAIVRTVERIRMSWPRSAPVLVPAVFALILAPIASVPLDAALHGIDTPTSGTAVLTNHAHHHNATLTASMREVLEVLESNPPTCKEDLGRNDGIPNTTPQTLCPNAVLVDDWNYRRGTWAILSPYHMLTRVGADIAVAAKEAAQSEQRREQYEALADFESIFAHGSSPAIQPLLEKHGIALLLTRNGPSADAFQKNPLLRPMTTTQEATLFRVR